MTYHSRIIVAGMHPQTAEFEKKWFNNCRTGRDDAREYQRDLQERGHITTYLQSGNATVHDPADCAFEIQGGVETRPLPTIVKYPYKVHSINTVNSRSEGSHIGFVKTLDEAMERAATCVKSWAQDHKGVVIFKAIKLVRLHDSPIEIIDL